LIDEDMRGFFDLNGDEIESQKLGTKCSEIIISPTVSIFDEAPPTLLTIKKYRGEKSFILKVSIYYTFALFVIPAKAGIHKP
jgi:hypothetical protein